MQLSRRGNRNVKAASFCLPALMFRVSTGGQSQAAFCLRVTTLLGPFDSAALRATAEGNDRG